MCFQFIIVFLTPFLSKVYMKESLPLAAGCFVTSCAFLTPAFAQTAPPMLKSAARSANLGGTLPHTNVRLNGETIGQLRQGAGPRTGFSSLASLPTLNGTETLTDAPRIERATDSGLPIFIQMPARSAASARNATAEPSQTSLSFLQALAGPMQVQQPNQEFQVVQVMPDALGRMHVRLQQIWKGLPVYGAEVVVHLDENGQPALFSGRYFRSPFAVASVTPVLAATAAIAQAETGLRAKTTFSVIPPHMQQLLHYTGPTTELVVFHLGAASAPLLAWHVTTRTSIISQWETFVDARTGTVVQQYESSCSVNGPRTATAPDLNGVSRTFNTYEWNNQFYLLDGAQPMFNLAGSTMPTAPNGALMTFDSGNAIPSVSTVTQMTSATNTWTASTQRSGVSAHYNAGVAYNYFRTTHNRNSIDGVGGTIISFARVADPANGQRLDNAFWNGSAMFYGEGNTAFRPLAGALDVSGHEMTHGVVGSSAHLTGPGQPGALNEHMADVFGCAMDPADWLIGEDVVLTSTFPSGALRSFSDPHNGATSFASDSYQPRTMAEYYTGSGDNYGVHVNDGIPNWAYYKFATAISRSHGEQIWYRALTTYLTRSSQFIDLRLAVIQSATDLYGATSADVAAARTAFDQVGILGTTPTPVTGNLPINPGQDYVLSYDTNPTVTGTWYRTSTTGTGFQRLANTEARCRASVSDRGTAAVYVDAQGRIRSLSLVGPFTETVIQNQPIWKSAALSKDGTKLAAVTVTADTAVYLFNIPAGTVARAHLYNPTNTTGVRGSGVRYADALEWDYSGEYLIYDAYNTLPSTAGAGISYWDIGIMRVWNNAQNTWGDGTIEKLIASLPAGVSIGNPVLAKVSPKVMAFDVLNANGGTTPFSVVATNVDTGVSGVVVAQNYFAGTPSYSKLDDKLLFTAKSTAGDTVVAVVNLQPNKVLPNGSASVLITQAKWGTWYAQGQRVLLGSRATTETLPGLTIYPNPVQDQLVIEWTGSAAVCLTLHDAMGRLVRTVPATPAGRAALSVTGLAAGTYVLHASDGQRTATRRITKE
jgi:bacillolysin